MDTNNGPLVSEATTLPTKPQFHANVALGYEDKTFTIEHVTFSLLDKAQDKAVWAQVVICCVI